MTACVMCSKPVENEASTGAVCRACFDSEQEASGAARTSFLSRVPLPLFVACLPFVISFRTSRSSSSTHDGVIESTTSFIDYVAITLGPLAVLMGLYALYASRSDTSDARTRNRVFAVLAVVIGAFQAYRGIG